MSLETTFDALVASVVQIQRRAESIVEKLRTVNSDVHGVFGEPDRGTIQATLDELLLDLQELCESSPLDACDAFAAEVERIPE